MQKYCVLAYEYNGEIYPAMYVRNFMRFRLIRTFILQLSDLEFFSIDFWHFTLLRTPAAAHPGEEQ